MLTEFSRQKATKDGLAYYCKPCRKKERAKYYRTHHKAIQTMTAKYRRIHRKEVLKKATRYAQAHRKEYRENHAKWRKGHPITAAYCSQITQLKKFKQAKTLKQIITLAGKNGHPDWLNLRIEVKLNWDRLSANQLARAYLDARKGLSYRIRLIFATPEPSMPIDFKDPWAYIEFMKQAAAREKRTVSLTKISN